MVEISKNRFRKSKNYMTVDNIVAQAAFGIGIVLCDALQESYPSEVISDAATVY